MAFDMGRVARGIWNGPFYIGKLSQPASLGDVLLKILETGWRAVVSLIVLGASAGLALYVWIEAISPKLFPPLEDSIRASVAYDDGSAKSPPPITFQAGGSSDAIEKMNSGKPFRCDKSYPVRIFFQNDSKQTIESISFSLEGREHGTSTNQVVDGSYLESDVIAEPGQLTGRCHSVEVNAAVDPANLDYSIRVWNARRVP